MLFVVRLIAICIYRLTKLNRTQFNLIYWLSLHAMLLCTNVWYTQWILFTPPPPLHTNRLTDRSRAVAALRTGARKDKWGRRVSGREIQRDLWRELEKMSVRGKNCMRGERACYWRRVVEIKTFEKKTFKGNEENCPVWLYGRTENNEQVIFSRFETWDLHSIAYYRKTRKRSSLITV